MSPFLLWNFISAISVIHAQFKLTLLPENIPGGQCLDGSPAGFYYSAPPSGSSDLWVLQLESGGFCADKTSCIKRANSSGGSSNYWPNAISITTGPLTENSTLNPDFYSGHHVFCPYCSGDLWSGLRTQPSSNPDTWGLYFSGHLIFEHITQYLVTNLGLSQAQYVLLTGPSAGGIGTFYNADWLTHYFVQNGKYGNKTTIKAAIVGGWLFPGNATDEPNNPMMPPNDYPHWIHHQQGGPWHNDSVQLLWDSYYDRRCVEALGVNASWHCSSAHNLYEYVETPLFIMENKFDKDQLAGFKLPNPSNTVNNETIGYVEYFGNDMDRSILTQMVDKQNDRNGLFYASCFDHCSGLGIGNTQKTIINGYSSSELVGDWFWNRNKLPRLVYDTCNNDTYQLPCNPTCDSYS